MNLDVGGITDTVVGDTAKIACAGGCTPQAREFAANITTAIGAMQQHQQTQSRGGRSI